MDELNHKFSKVLRNFGIVAGILFLVTLGALFVYAQDMLSSNESEQTTLQPPRRPATSTTGNAQDDEDEEVVYPLSLYATAYQVELFEALIEAHHRYEQLGSDEALKAYAAAITSSFIADFFTLSNKVSRFDVGGLHFFSDEVADDFAAHATDHFYLHLGRHIQTFGHEALPTVNGVEVLHVAFGWREVEDEEEIEFEFDLWGNPIFPEPQEPVFERTVVVDVSWTFESTTLAAIDLFQTTARVTLMEVEDEGLRIFQIEEIPIECERDAWGVCIVPEPADCQRDAWGVCIELEPTDCETDAWGVCVEPGLAD